MLHFALPAQIKALQPTTTMTSILVYKMNNISIIDNL